MRDHPPGDGDGDLARGVETVLRRKPATDRQPAHTQRGGGQSAPFSHAAFVSREIGIPCIVSATDATKRIPDGALVEVDGTTGTVTVIQTAD